MFEKICIILLANFVFYFKTLSYRYCSDDIPSSQRLPHPNKWMHRYLVLEGHLKSTPVIDHAITMMLHSLVCVGIYLGFGQSDISFWAALLFSFNPVNNQASVWISGRGYALSALGMTWAFAFPIMSPIFLFLATYSNAGFLMPIVILGSSTPLMMVTMPFIWKFHSRNFKKNVVARMDTEMFVEDKRIHVGKLILATKTFGFYLAHALIPFKTTFYHSTFESISGSRMKHAYTFCRFFWIGLLALATIAWYVSTHKWDMVCFAMLWWCIAIAPFCNLIRMSQESAERYCYVPNCGLMFILATVIHAHPAVVTGFMLMYMTKMWFYMDAFQDEYYLIEYACLHSPDSWFAWHIRGHKRWETQSYKEALIMWVMARKIAPNEFKILYNLAVVCLVANHKKEADEWLELAKTNIPLGQEASAAKLMDEFKKGNVTVLV